MSSANSFDPRRLDVAAFARAQADLAGTIPLADLERLSQDARPEAERPADHEISWSAQGELRPVAGASAEIRLHLRAATELQLTCQRCLQPVRVSLLVQPTLRFVEGEDLAARIDEESEEDVLALSSTMDLRELIEDELILALPLVPRHDRCAQPLPTTAEPGDVPGTASAANPFAALAGLRRRGDASD